MAKALLSPLLLGLISLIVAQVVLYRSWRRLPLRVRYALVALSLTTVLLWVSGTPAMADRFAGVLEAPFAGGGVDTPGRIDAIVVLASGFVRGPTPDRDRLDEAGYARVMKGVAVYKESGANWLVMSGATADDQPDRLPDYMKRLAVTMGIPASRVVTDSVSLNTFMHPETVARLPEINPQDRIAVVTSAWHLPRAMGEFRRLFPVVIPVPADFLSTRNPARTLDWIPSAGGLKTFTTVLHEYIGQLWYGVRHGLALASGINKTK